MKKLMIIMTIFLITLLSGCEKYDENTCWRCERYIYTTVNDYPPIWGWERQSDRIYCSDDGYTLKKLEKNTSVVRVKCNLYIVQ